MKKIIYLTIIYFLFIIILINCTLPSFSYDIYNTYEDSIDSEAAILVDINSGSVLYSKKEDNKFNPSYLVKIMTGVLVLENTSSLNDTFMFSYNAVMKDNKTNTEKIGSTPGDILTIKDGLYSMFCTQANDVANALAEYSAGNIADFVKLMNAKAITLDMHDTHFTNVTGLYDENQYSTCSDMRKLITYALQNATFRDMTTVTTYTHAPIKRYKDPLDSNNTLIQTNLLLRKNSKFYEKNITSAIYGGNKTNGYSFATSKQIDDMHLLLVNMNVSSLTKGYNDIKNLLKYGFENYKGIKIINNDKTFNRTLGALKLGNVYLNFPESLIVSDSSSVTLPIDLKFSDLTKVLSFKETNPNDLNSLGVIKYYYDNVLVGIASIVGFQTKVITNVDITNLSASGYISTAIINNTNQENTIDNPSSPIYRNKDGKLIISASIYKVFIYIIILIICALLFLILRSMFYNYRHNKRRNRK